MPASTEGAFGVTQPFRSRVRFSRQPDLQASNDPGPGDGQRSVDVQQVQMIQVMIDQYVGKEMFVICPRAAGRNWRIPAGLHHAQRCQHAFGRSGDRRGRRPGADSMLAIQEKMRPDLADEDSELSQALEKFEFPPIIIGSKVSDGADEVVAQLEALGAELPPIFTADKIDVGRVRNSPLGSSTCRMWSMSGRRRASTSFSRTRRPPSGLRRSSARRRSNFVSG